MTWPVNAGPLINTANFEGGPSLSQDGLTLLVGAARQNSLGQLDEDIYVATRETVAESFGPPQNLGPPINSLGYGDYSPELSRDGLTLYFSSSRPGGLGAADLYVTTRESTEDPWEPPQNLGPNVNSPYFEGQPSISANGRTLYWNSDRPDGLGDFDIWMATREAFCETFGPAVNVGPVNTPGPDFGPAISQNDRQLFFSSGRPGNVGQIDIWVVERRKNRKRAGPWGTPINVDTLNSPSAADELAALKIHIPKTPTVFRRWCHARRRSVGLAVAVKSTAYRPASPALHRSSTMASIWQDIRFGLRMLRHGKGVTGAAATLFVSTMAAGLLPAWRATRYDPATILRRE